MPTRVHLMYTYYPHWGQYSGINQFIKYVNPQKIAIDAQVVPKGDSNFPIYNAWVRQCLRRLARRINLSTVPMYELNDLVAEWVALRQWWRGHVDILHYLNAEHSLQYLPLVLRKFPVLTPKPPIVATFHQPPQLLNRSLNTDIVHLLDRVVVVSPTQVAFFEQYLPSQRISLILHGIDVEHFRPGIESKDMGTFRCLTVGFWFRDYDTLLAVAERLQVYSDIEFHVVSSKFKSLPHLRNVYVYTAIDDKTLLEMYQQSDVLFLPLIDSTANNALLEGIACGLPVISTELASVRAYVSENEAILIPENNLECTINAILKLYHNPKICEEMSASARERALDFSWQNIALEYETMYLSVVS